MKKKYHLLIYNVWMLKIKAWTTKYNKYIKKQIAEADVFVRTAMSRDC